MPKRPPKYTTIESGIVCASVDGRDWCQHVHVDTLQAALCALRHRESHPERVAMRGGAYSENDGPAQLLWHRESAAKTQIRVCEVLDVTKGDVGLLTELDEARPAVPFRVTTSDLKTSITAKPALHTATTKRTRKAA